MSRNTSTAKAAIFMGAAQVCRLMVTFLTAPLLGRLLQPSDFGLIATAAPLVGFISVIQNLGLTMAIIQRPTITKAQANALFWLSLLVSAVLACGLWVLAPLLAEFFREPRLTVVVRVSAILIVLAVMGEQPRALLTRDLRFKPLALFDIVSAVLGGVLSVAVAWYSQSYWALLAPVACTRVVNLFGAAVVARWFPGIPVWDDGTRQMIGFGAGLSTFNILNFIARNADNLLIARVHGSTALGFYDCAYKLMLLPLTQATWPLSRVVGPILSRLQDQSADYRRTYADAVSFLMLAVQPGALCAVVFADATVTLLLGNKWSDAAPIFAWLGIVGLHQIFTSTLSWLFMSQGRAREFAILGVATSISTVASFVVGLPWGPLGVAIAYVMSDYILRLPLTWYMVGRKGHVSTRDICMITGPHLIGLLLSASILIMLKSKLPMPSIIELASLVAMSYLLNCGVLVMFVSKRNLMVQALHAVRIKITLPRGG